ncbi:hypothetical protein [Pareuzebyella sediminis]|uniref:hypothetical protein n=1 Tax=Pareuzebyella sediminis TaxID=2607998 RepID=UPI0011EE0968|nr:hypothetical protein [Pareuzebyella sediminis]
MNEIHILYQNPLGIAFRWKNNVSKDDKKIQLVFRDTGLLLDKSELAEFSLNIKEAMKSEPLCNDCKQNHDCRALLLETPFPSLSFAVSHKELTEIDDLVVGTMFQLQLDGFLDGIL